MDLSSHSSIDEASFEDTQRTNYVWTKEGLVNRDTGEITLFSAETINKKFYHMGKVYETDMPTPRAARDIDELKESCPEQKYWYTNQISPRLFDCVAMDFIPAKLLAPYIKLCKRVVIRNMFFASSSELVEIMGVPKNNINRTTNELMEYKLLRIHQNNGRTGSKLIELNPFFAWCGSNWVRDYYQQQWLKDN